MKKILAIAMAIVMMMAIAVPAFAATETITGGKDDGSKTEILTLTTKEDGSDPTWYTVTIPASQTIYWEATSTAIEYTINSQLATANKVKVTVSGSGLMTNGTDTLAYDITDAEYTSSAAVVVDEADTVTIDTSAAAWTTVPVDSYSDTLTFTAAIV